jgi:hypothetical protein
MARKAQLHHRYHNDSSLSDDRESTVELNGFATFREECTPECRKCDQETYIVTKRHTYYFRGSGAISQNPM